MKKIESEEDLREAFSDLKTGMLIGKKMFQDGYREESKRLKDMEKKMMRALDSKIPMNEGDLCTGMALMYKELQGILLVLHQMHLSHVKTVESIAQTNIVLNSIIPLLKDFANTSELKTTHKKIKRIEKAQKTLQQIHDDIFSKVKQKYESQNKSTKTNLTYIR